MPQQVIRAVAADSGGPTSRRGTVGRDQTRPFTGRTEAGQGHCHRPLHEKVKDARQAAHLVKVGRNQMLFSGELGDQGASSPVGLEFRQQNQRNATAEMHSG